MRIEAQRIGQYTLGQCLRQDSGNETWHAYDTVAQQPVILKFYRTDQLTTADALTTYLQSIEQVASLHHPNIAHIHDIQVISPQSIGSTTPMVCLAVEYIKGQTFADYMKSTAGKIPPAAAIAQLFSNLALALDNAQLRGIMHGNLKPTNILLTQDSNISGKIGSPILTDFAASKVVAKKQGNDIPFYLAPEQIKGNLTEKRSDIYALGVMLYELYTGQPPFRGNRPIAVMMQHVNATPTPPDLMSPGISPALSQIILCCLAKDPLERFPNATSLAMGLARALHVAVPENLRRFATVSGLPIVPDFSDHHPAKSTTTSDQQNSSSHSGEMDSGSPVPPRRKNRALIFITIISLVAILGAIIATISFKQRNAASPLADGGQAFFINSGQLNENTTQGINDELQINLSNLPALASGKSYYAWLLGDLSQTEALPLSLGRLTVENGNVNFLYPGDNAHNNLLAVNSRFLITEDNTQNPSSNPLLDTSSWRYYTVLPQTPNPADPLHFSMLDHLRHLLVESPELAIRGLHGGLAFWFAKDTATVANLTSSLTEDWQNQDTDAIYNQIIRILDYLDSPSSIGSDVPVGTPYLADQQTSQVALLGPAPEETNPPGYVYQDEPSPGYVYLIQSHLNGAILSSQTTQAQHQLATQINGGIDSARRALMQVYQDAKELAHLTQAQLLQASSLTLLNTIATQAQNAYTGQPNPTSGTSQEGALWIYNNLQRLAAFAIVPYTTPAA